MSTNCSHRRLPPPLRGPDDVVDAIAIATHEGEDRAVVIACLDRARRPLTLFIVDDAPAAADDVVLAVDVLLDVVRGRDTPLAALSIGVSRPGGSAEPTEADLDAFRVVGDRCAAIGLALLDWYVLAGDDVRSVGQLLGLERW